MREALRRFHLFRLTLQMPAVRAAATTVTCVALFSVASCGGSDEGSRNSSPGKPTLRITGGKVAKPPSRGAAEQLRRHAADSPKQGDRQSGLP